MISLAAVAPGAFASAGIHRLCTLRQLDLLTVAGDSTGELAPWRNRQNLAAIAASLTPGSDPTDSVLASWFVLGEPVAERAARAQVPGLLVDLLLAAGVLRAEDGLLSGNYCLLRVDGITLFAARRAAGWASGPYAPWIGTDSVALCRLVTARARARTALDLGCGTGVLGISAARNGADVLALDIDPECTGATAFNARLNGLDQLLEVRTADMLSMALDTRFDLVVANPPYLPVPRGTWGWLAGEAGLDGLQFFWHIVRQARGLLSPRGEALIKAAAYGDGNGPFCVSELDDVLARLDLAGTLLLSPATRRRWPPFADVDEQSHLTGETGLKVDDYVRQIGATHYYSFVLALRPASSGGLVVGRFR